MAKNTTKKENPLLSKNIPKPPMTSYQEEQHIEAEDGITVTEQNAKAPERESSFSYPEQAVEKATVEISLYLKPSQDDKLEDLKREYKRRTRKKISSNQIMRLLIDRATIDDLF